MSSMTTVQSGLCASCNNITTNVCNGCQWTPDSTDGEPTKTYYCNSTCQREDWPNHKAACKVIQQRKSLFRAGLILQNVFYKLRERLFDKLILKVERKDAILYLHEGDYGSDDSFLFRFPSHLFDDEQERNTVLANLSCDDIVGNLHVFTQMLLEGIESEIEEVFLEPKRRIQLVQVDVRGVVHEIEDEHLVIYVLLKCGDEYALDVAGAQYGYHEPVLSWDLYMESRVEKLRNFRSFGSGQLKSLIDRDDEKDTAFGHIKKINRAFAAMLNKSLKIWQNRNTPLSALLKLPEDTFQQKHLELISFLEQDLPTGPELEKLYREALGDKEGLEGAKSRIASVQMAEAGVTVFKFAGRS